MSVCYADPEQHKEAKLVHFALADILFGVLLSLYMYMLQHVNIVRVCRKYEFWFYKHFTVDVQRYSIVCVCVFKL